MAVQWIGFLQKIVLGKVNKNIICITKWFIFALLLLKICHFKSKAWFNTPQKEEWILSEKGICFTTIPFKVDYQWRSGAKTPFHMNINQPPKQRHACLEVSNCIKQVLVTFKVACNSFQHFSSLTLRWRTNTATFISDC